MKTMIGVAAVIILAFVALRLMAQSKGDPKVVKQKIQSGALVLDVRTPGEYSGGHYNGAKNIPVDDLAGRLKDVGEKQKSIVVYCRSGARSARAKSILEAAGYTDVTNAGGFGDMPHN
ncbi:MAG: rhodanese-like domain-containing protein [Spirochaetia bacterium]|nr:rhodanese-like domain-containing protein [Spirochaetia bacterium]